MDDQFSVRIMTVYRFYCFLDVIYQANAAAVHELNSQLLLNPAEQLGEEKTKLERPECMSPEGDGSQLRQSGRGMGVFSVKKRSSLL